MTECQDRTAFVPRAEYDRMASEIERLRAALETVRIFLDGEIIGNALVIDAEGRFPPGGPTLMQTVTRALEQSARD